MKSKHHLLKENLLVFLIIFDFICIIISSFKAFYAYSQNMYSTHFCLSFNFPLDLEPYYNYYNYPYQIAPYGFNYEILSQKAAFQVADVSEIPIKLEIKEESLQKTDLSITPGDLQKFSVPKIQKIWTNEQDKLLKQLFSLYGNDWLRISEYFKDKTPKQCYGRHRRVQKLSANHRKWAQREDQLIIQCYSKFGRQWKQYVPYFQDRNSKQIRERYLNYLDPSVKNEKWSIDQDIKLLKLLEEHGKKWKSFQKTFLGRSQNNIKNRYYGHLQKILKTKEKQDKKEASTVRSCSSLKI